MSVFFRRRGTLTIVVTITGAGNATDCYAIINGTKQYEAGTYKVYVGDTITFGIHGGADIGWVKIDGTKVAEAWGETVDERQTYDWTVPSEISAIKIRMKDTSSYSQITVTTS